MSNNKYRILIIEDDHSVAALLRTMLDAQQYETLLAGTCDQGLMMLRSHVPDLVILDLGLPDRDGLDFIRTARENNAVPILVLSARSTEKDKVTALDLGANDYITKPFSTAELLASVRAALRYSRPGAQQGRLPESRFQLHDLVIEYDNRVVMVAAQPVHLTQMEFNILALLAQHAGKLLTYATINEAIWGAADPSGNKKLQVNMANLRRKLGIRPGDNRYIVNELGVGYRMQQGEDAGNEE
jgi:two-component system KDP operon response regulator KdpE